VGRQNGCERAAPIVIGGRTSVHSQSYLAFLRLVSGTNLLWLEVELGRLNNFSSPLSSKYLNGTIYKDSTTF
jgi:hypothetical protein